MRKKIICAEKSDVAVELLRKSFSHDESFPRGVTLLSLKMEEQSSASPRVLFFVRHKMHEDDVDLTDNEDVIKRIGLNVCSTWDVTFSGDDNKVASVQVAAKKESDMQEMSESEILKPFFTSLHSQICSLRSSFLFL